MHIRFQVVMTNVTLLSRTVFKGKLQYFEPCLCQNALFIIIQRISTCGIITKKTANGRARLPYSGDIEREQDHSLINKWKGI